MSFICHVEHPHKFICNYLATLLKSQELSQDAWNLANDSLRTTLCVRLKSEVIACGVVYADARRFKMPLSENPPWWKAFDAEKHQIDEVCRVIALLYHRPKARYISVCKDGETFTSNKLWDSKSESVPKVIEPSSTFWLFPLRSVGLQQTGKPSRRSLMEKRKKNTCRSLRVGEMVARFRRGSPGPSTFVSWAVLAWKGTSSLTCCSLMSIWLSMF